MNQRLSNATLERLVRYYRYVEELSQNGETRVRSEQLADETGYTSARVRRDLTFGGALGVPGIGYAIDTVLQTLRSLLDKHQPRMVGLVGVGHLGLALIRHYDFWEHGFYIVAGFDNDPQKVGHSMDGVFVYEISQMARVCALLQIEMGILAVPSEQAEHVLKEMLAAGIYGILNFTTCRFSVPDHIHIHNIDLSIPMEILSYSLEGHL